jgi:hypothetical protein
MKSVKDYKFKFVENLTKEEYIQYDIENKLNNKILELKETEEIN